MRGLWPSVRSADLVDVQLIPGKENVICLRVRKPISFHYSCAFSTPRQRQPMLRGPFGCSCAPCHHAVQPAPFIGA